VTATTAPEWLTRSEPALCQCATFGRRRKGRVIERTIAGGASLLRQAMFSDDVARRRGLLQHIDARIKVIVTLGLLLTIALARTIPVLAALYLGTLLLAAMSGLSISFFLKRVWLFVPLFTGVIVLPATLNIVTPGDVVVPLGTWFGRDIGMTSQGLTSAGLLVSRVAASISLAVLLTLTTPWSRLLAALRTLFVPRMFVLVLGMAYRYLFHLLGAVTDMYTARRARMVGVAMEHASGRRFVAASAGALFGKAHALSDEVHMAMVSRGYTGDARMTSAGSLRLHDLCFGMGCLAVAIVALGADRVVAG
jgi:cobalt/nickel transport system permease protein